MKKFSLKGIGVALVTPFRENGNIDFNALESIVKHIKNGNVDYIVVLGTTGEAPTLSLEETVAVTRSVREVVNGEIPLVLGMGGNNTSEIINRMQSTDLSGFSALLSVVPFYNKPNQEGMYRHYKTLSEHSPLPLIIYNVPGRTGANILPPTILRLAKECPNIIGVKEASGSIPAVSDIVYGKPDDFDVVSGDDALTLPMMAVGASGVISVVGNAFPKEFAELVHSAAAGDFAKARALHQRFNTLYKLMFAEGNPAGIKCALSCLGLAENNLRLPLVPVGAICRKQIEEAVKTFQDATE